MERHVVAISIDKVQSFLFYVLYASVQEKQTNSDTLSTIIESSRLISDQFYEDIRFKGNDSLFAHHMDEQLLTASGMYIFTTSLPADKIGAKLDSLFQLYYQKYNGQLLMKYVYFPQDSIQEPSQHNKSEYKLLAIKESKQRLRADSCLNRIIANNQCLLFNFSKSSDPLGLNSLPKVQMDKYTSFTKTINDLFLEQHAHNKNHFRIAVIKGDLDDMGSLLENIKDYKTYKTISELLSEHVSLENLHRTAEEYRKNNPEFRLFPLYVAGDDIFFAVPVSQLIVGVELCTRILKQINQKIKFAGLKSESGVPLTLSMSVGIDFTFNREPIRYYYERVQLQLDIAKSEKNLEYEDTCSPTSCTKISINNYVMHHFELPNDKLKKILEDNRDITNWGHTVHAVKRLQQAMRDGFEAHHFLYGLLNKITNPVICSSNQKYSNAVFYHLIPQYMESQNESLRDSELMLLESIMNQLMKKYEYTNYKNEKKNKSQLSFAEMQRKRLEGYIRLLLLFSDPRFKITGPANNIALDANRVKSTLFNKSLRYIYNSLTVSKFFKDSKDLRDMFIKQGHYYPERNSSKGYKDKDPHSKVEVYRTLRISNSLFHKLKHLDDDINTVAELLAATNPQTVAEVEELESKASQEHKAPPGIAFVKEDFIKLNNQSKKLWTPDYVDSLLVFYQLREKSIQLRNRYDFKALKEEKNKKQGRRKR